MTVNQYDQIITHMETKMGDLLSAHNELVDGFADHDDELQLINLKNADLEDRSRRNNIKFCNIPESIQQSDIVQFLQSLMQSLMQALLPDLTTRDMEIDRAHRLPKPSHLPASTPRDVLARIHFFTTKEKIMYAAKRATRLPDPFTNIALYADLSKATMENRRQLATITKVLQNHKIPYKWGFLTKLLITHQNKTHTVRTLPMGLTLLRNISSQRKHRALPLTFQPSWRQEENLQTPEGCNISPSLHKPNGWDTAAALSSTCLPAKRSLSHVVDISSLSPTICLQYFLHIESRAPLLLDSPFLIKDLSP